MTSGPKWPSQKWISGSRARPGRRAGAVVFSASEGGPTRPGTALSEPLTEATPSLSSSSSPVSDVPPPSDLKPQTSNPSFPQNPGFLAAAKSVLVSLRSCAERHPNKGGGEGGGGEGMGPYVPCIAVRSDPCIAVWVPATTRAVGPFVAVGTVNAVRHGAGNYRNIVGKYLCMFSGVILFPFSYGVLRQHTTNEYEGPYTIHASIST